MTTTITSATAANAYAPAASPTPASKTSGIANLAVSLSNDSSLIASIGGTSTSSATVYNAQGLMSNFLQAAAQNAASSTGSTTSASGDDSTTAASGSDATSGATGSSGSTSDGSTGGNASMATSGTDPSAFNGTPQWAEVLKANPSLSGVFLADSTNQMLVNQLSVFA